MLEFLSHFASEDNLATEAESGDVLASLGIDFQILILQTIAFAILVFILAKFIYPKISAMLDRRDKIVNDALEAARLSEEKAAELEAETAEALNQARKQANQIVETAKKESANLMTESEFEANKKAELIIRSAKDDRQREIAAARRALRQESLDLVAAATEKIIGLKLSDDDASLVEKTLKGRS